MVIGVNAESFGHWDEVLASHQEIIPSILRDDVAAVMRSMDENLAKMFERIPEMLTDRWHGEKGEDLLHARAASYSQAYLGRS